MAEIPDIPEIPDIDLHKINFPSDGLTIKTLRQLAPHYFDTEQLVTGKLLDDKADNPMQPVITMLDAERCVAEGAFVKTLQGIKTDPGFLRDVQGCIEDAKQAYIQLGLAKGEHHADQLIRDIESQAVDQARQHTGRHP